MKKGASIYSPPYLFYPLLLFDEGLLLDCVDSFFGFANHFLRK